jgi:hypothetical protein
MVTQDLFVQNVAMQKLLLSKRLQALQDFGACMKEGQGHRGVYASMHAGKA